MIGMFKLAGLSAVLSAGLVTGFDELRSTPSPAGSAKLFQERLGDALAPAPSGEVGRLDLNLAAKSDRLDAGCEEATGCLRVRIGGVTGPRFRVSDLEAAPGATVALKAPLAR